MQSVETLELCNGAMHTSKPCAGHANTAGLPSRRSDIVHSGDASPSSCAKSVVWVTVAKGRLVFHNGDDCGLDDSETPDHNCVLHLRCDHCRRIAQHLNRSSSMSRVPHTAQVATAAVVASESNSGGCNSSIVDGLSECWAAARVATAADHMR